MIIFSYAFLIIAILSRWIFSRSVSFVLLFVSLGFAFFAHIMALPGLLALILLFEMIYLLQKEQTRSLSLIYQILVATIAILIAKHMFGLPSYDHYQLLNNTIKNRYA